MKNSDFPGELALFCAIAGAVAAFLKSLIHHIFEWVGHTVDFYDMITAYLTHGHHKVEGLSEWIFSEIGDLVLGALFAIILGFWLKNSRAKYHWWIGLGYGFGVWFASLVLGNLTKILERNMTNPLSLFAHLIAMIAYGLLFVGACRLWKPLRKRIEPDGRQG